MSHGLPELKGEEKRSLAMCLKNVKNHKYLVNSMHDHYDLTYTREASNLGLPRKQHMLCMFEPKDLSSLKRNQILCSCLFSSMTNSHMKKILTSSASLGQTTLLIMLLGGFHVRKCM